jgi:hypothetical protein
MRNTTGTHRQKSLKKNKRHLLESTADAKIVGGEMDEAVLEALNQMVTQSQASTPETVDTSIEAVNAEINHQGGTVEIVGRWYWASFTEKPSQELREMMKSVGYRWNPKRRVWQNSNGAKCRHSNADTAWLKMKYGAVRMNFDEGDESLPSSFSGRTSRADEFATQRFMNYRNGGKVPGV